MLVIWPQGKQALDSFGILMAFMKAYNSLWRWRSRAPFGATKSCPFWHLNKMWGGGASLGRMVYMKPTYTGLYLNSWCHRHPMEKRGVMIMLIDRAHYISDYNHRKEELNDWKCCWGMAIQNRKFIVHLQILTREEKRHLREKKTQYGGVAVVPYCPLLWIIWQGF